MNSTETAKKHILLIDDDHKLSDMIAQFLESMNYKVSIFDKGNGAINAVKRAQPDLIVLDVMLPGLDGVEICRQIKLEDDIPILMMTAKGDDMTEIMAMNFGADAYLNKPVRPHVLQAHISAMLKKQTKLQTDDQNVLEIQDLKINKESYQVYKNDEEVSLTAGEFQLLLLLAENTGHPIGREELLKELKGMDYDGLDRSIDIRVSNLRKKLDDEIPPYKYIKTIRNQGYLLVK